MKFCIGILVVFWGLLSVSQAQSDASDYEALEGLHITEAIDWLVSQDGQVNPAAFAHYAQEVCEGEGCLLLVFMMSQSHPELSPDARFQVLEALYQTDPLEFSDGAEFEISDLPVRMAIALVEAALEVERYDRAEMYIAALESVRLSDPFGLTSQGLLIAELRQELALARSDFEEVYSRALQKEEAFWSLVASEAASQGRALPYDGARPEPGRVDADFLASLTNDLPGSRLVSELLRQRLFLLVMDAGLGQCTPTQESLDDLIELAAFQVSSEAEDVWAPDFQDQRFALTQLCFLEAIADPQSPHESCEQASQLEGEDFGELFSPYLEACSIELEAEGFQVLRP